MSTNKFGLYADNKQVLTLAQFIDNTLDDNIRSSVLGVAEAMVVKDGLPHLNIRTLAVKTGYSVGNISRVFKNQNDLILHIKSKALDEIANHMEQVDHSSPEQCLEGLVNAYISFARQNPSRWRMVFEHNLPKGMETPEWYKRKVETIFRKFEVQLAMLSPELVPEEIKQTTVAFWGGVHGICVFHLASKLGGLTEHDFEEGINLYVKRFIHDSWLSGIGERAPSNFDSLFYVEKLVLH